jgi:hypothetical protein
MIALALIVLGSCCAFAQGPTSSNQGCSDSTVDDAFGGEMATKARAFLAVLKAEVKMDNRRKIASMVAYPLRVFVGEEKRIVRNPSEFLAHYEDIITPHVKDAILKQSVPCLFGNYQGAMIGQGEVWFQEQRDGAFGIISVNTGASPKVKGKARKPEASEFTR